MNKADHKAWMRVVDRLAKNNPIAALTALKLCGEERERTASPYIKSIYQRSKSNTDNGNTD